jgi:hypothetical protein
MFFTDMVMLVVTFSSLLSDHMPVPIRQVFPSPAMMPVVIYKQFSDNLGLHEHLPMRMNQIFKMRFSRM